MEGKFEYMMDSMTWTLALLVPSSRMDFLAIASRGQLRKEKIEHGKEI
jgi:hypothetical protein